MLNLKSFTWTAIKDLAAANMPAVIAGAVAILLGLLAGWQGCVAKNTKDRLQAREESLVRSDDRVTAAERRALELQEKLSIQEERTRSLSEQLDKARKRIKEPVLGADGKLLLTPAGQPVYRLTDETSERTDRMEMSVYQIKLDQTVQRAEQAELLAEERRAAFVQASKELKELKESQSKIKPWLAGLGPTVNGPDGGVWWASLGYKAALGTVDVGALASYPVVKQDGNSSAGSAIPDIRDRPLLIQALVNF